MSNIITSQHLEDFRRICPKGVFKNISLSEISRWKIGGIADCIIRPKNAQEVSKLVKYLHTANLPFMVIGSTSNLLFPDEGVRAVIIQIGNRMSDYTINDKRAWVQAGKWVPGLARNIAQAGLSGIEHTAGIPGTIGGLICMNGGSQRKGVGSHVSSVKAVSPTGEIIEFTKENCGFEYRTSIFQKNNHIIVEGELEFDTVRSYSEIRDEMLGILRSRRAKFPQKLPNCGSTFISNPDIYKKYGPPGKVIEDLGYKGFKIGDAQISKNHANFINNIGNAKAKDVLMLIQKIQKSVFEHTGFDMKAEVKFVDKNGNIKPAHLVK